MKNMAKILSIVMTLVMLISAMSLFPFAEGEKTYTYTLDFENLSDENDYFDIFKSKWDNDYANIKANSVQFNVVASGSGPHSKNIGYGLGFGTSECRVYRCVTNRKNYFENDNAGYTTVFKFTAPVKGTYSTYLNIPVVVGDTRNTNIFYFIGSDDAGFTMNTVGGTTQGRHDFTHTALEGKYKMTFDLEKGQSIAMCILAWSNMIYEVSEISVTLSNAAEEPPVITTEPETEPVQTTPEQTEPEQTTTIEPTTEPENTEPEQTTGENKDGGKKSDVLPIVIGAVAAVVVIAVIVAVIVKKKK